MFSTQIKVRFNHCDPAGIVFYPRYYEMFNQVVEEWFEEQLGFDFKMLGSEYNAGVPVVSLDVDFMGASRLGDILTFELLVDDVGTSSIKLQIEAKDKNNDKDESKDKKSGEIRLRAKMVLVYTVNNPEDIKAQPIPEHVKDCMLNT